jgi:curved DNA-binding protein CbpA
MAETIHPYKVLQVDPEAEDEVIQAAYRRLARKYHPDLAETPEAAARMSRINAAWELIGDPAARRAFDRKRATEAATTGRAGETGNRSSAAGTTAPGRPAPVTHPLGTKPPSSPQPGPAARPPETVSRDWTSGRSTQGSGYDDSMRTAQGFAAAGPPPGRPTGTVLNFGRYAGWSLGEVARRDIEYIEWLDRAPIGRNYRQEVDDILRSSGRRRSAEAEDADRRGLYRRR